MWVRGLKLYNTANAYKSYAVAPHVGAWIETYSHPYILTLQPSHPMWVRGLKLPNLDSSQPWYDVAPHVGAWIETLPLAKVPTIIGSHPMWVRGLKQSGCGTEFCYFRRTPCGCVD